jgi:hypothetical protein
MWEILSQLANKRITPNDARKQLKGIGLSDDDIDFHMGQAQDPANLANYPLEPTDAESVTARQRAAYASILPLSRERTQAGRRLAAGAAQRSRFGGGAFSGFAQQAMDRAFDPEDLMSRFLLDRFGTQQAGGPIPAQAPSGSFEAFARRAPLRGDADIQSIQLRNILSELEGFAKPGQMQDDARMEFRQALQGAYANPDAAFNAALQPVLSRIAPALEAAFLGQAQRDYRGALSDDPLQFTTAAGSFRHLEPYFRDRTPRDVT